MNERRAELLFWAVLLISTAVLLSHMPYPEFIAFPLRIRADDRTMDDENWPKVVAWLGSAAATWATYRLFWG